MSAFGGKADIECLNCGHKKARHNTGLLVFLVAGAGFESQFAHNRISGGVGWRELTFSDHFVMVPCPSLAFLSCLQKNAGPL